MAAVAVAIIVALVATSGAATVGHQSTELTAVAADQFQPVVLPSELRPSVPPLMASLAPDPGDQPISSPVTRPTPQPTAKAVTRPTPTPKPKATPKPVVKRAVKPAPKPVVKTATSSVPTVAYARSYALSRIGSTQFSCLDSLWTKESNWNPRAYNRSSGAYGIPQALPGSKMGTIASDWRTNPLTQVKWGLGYISGRYGTACAAWNHSVHYNWY